MRSRTRQWLAAAALAVGLATPLAATADEDTAALRLVAFAVDLAAPSARIGTIEIVIERWTTDAEHDRLRATLMEKGSSGLRTALRDITPRAGYLRGTVTLGWNLRFARELPLPDGGRRIVIATDRPMCFWELWGTPPSADCEFTLAEIRLGPDGRGEGKLVTAAKVIWNDVSRTIEIANYALEPARLDEVRVTDGR
jgi:hypothetical protein